MNVEQLRTKLRIMRRDRSEIVCITEEEIKYFDLKEFELEIQIETQTFRDAIHSAFRVCRHWDKDGKLVTLFEWETFKQTSLKAIAEHEQRILKRIELRKREYYTDETGSNNSKATTQFD